MNRIGAQRHVTDAARGVESLLTASISELDAHLGEGDVTAVELVTAAFQRVDRENKDVNAVVTVAESAFSAARESDQRTRRRQRLSQLDGIPFTVKDNIVTRGVRTTVGSVLLKDHVPRVTAPAVKRLQDAGAILVGKTNCPEFALDIHTSNRLFGHTWNPLHLHLTSGGSSGGESAAIAAGFVSFGLGTDFGGSIRWPAHCTGLASIRPTPGFVPNTGMLPHSSAGTPAPPNSMSVQHQLHLIAPIARHISDLEVILKTIAGPDGRDICAVPVPYVPWQAGVGSLRCACLTGEGNYPVRRDLIAPVEAAARTLADQGNEIVTTTPPGFHLIEPIYARLRDADGLPFQLRRLARGREELLSDNIRDRLRAERVATTAELRKLAGARDAVRARILRFMDRCDVLLMPVASVPAYQPDSDRYDEPSCFDVDGVTVPRLKALSCTAVITALGLPAAAVPFGMSRDGLPVGVQIVGRPFADATVLAVARFLEAARRNEDMTAQEAAQNERNRGQASRVFAHP